MWHPRCSVGAVRHRKDPDHEYALTDRSSCPRLASSADGRLTPPLDVPFLRRRRPAALPASSPSTGRSTRAAIRNFCAQSSASSFHLRHHRPVDPGTTVADFSADCTAGETTIMLDQANYSAQARLEGLGRQQSHDDDPDRGVRDHWRTRSPLPSTSRQLVLNQDSERGGDLRRGRGGHAKQGSTVWPTLLHGAIPTLKERANHGHLEHADQDFTSRGRNPARVELARWAGRLRYAGRSNAEQLAGGRAARRRHAPRPHGPAATS